MTDLFVRPPYRFRVVDGLITNFHLPRSTLLMLVAAFGGYERAMEAYGEGVPGGVSVLLVRGRDGGGVGE